MTDTATATITDDEKRAILRRAYAIAADYVHESRQDAIQSLSLRCARIEIVGKALADQLTREEQGG